MFSQRLLSNRISLGQRSRRPRDCGGEFPRFRDQEYERIRIVLRLCHQIRCDKGWLAFVTKNQTLRRTCQEINGAIKRDNLLGSGHKQISRPDNFVYPRNAFRSVGQRGNRLRAADAVELTHSQQRGRRQRRRGRARRDHSNILHSRHLGWNHGHQQCRGQGIASAGHVTSD